MGWYYGERCENSPNYPQILCRKIYCTIWVLSCFPIPQINPYISLVPLKISQLSKKNLKDTFVEGCVSKVKGTSARVGAVEIP